MREAFALLLRQVEQFLKYPWMWFVLRAAAVLLVTVVFWRLAGALRRWINWAFGKLEGFIEGRAKTLPLRVLSGAAGPLSTALETLAGLLRILAWFVLLYSWVLILALLLDESQRYAGLVLDPLHQAMDRGLTAVVSFLPDLVILVLIVALGRVLQSVVEAIGRAIALGRISAPGLDPTVAAPTRRILTFILWVSMVILAMPYLPGSESKAFQAVSVLLGLLVSLGSSSLVSNLIGGLSLTYVHAFRTGDRVKIGEHLGDIVALGAVTTRLRTIKDEEIILPNGVVSSAVIVNYSRYASSGGVQASARVSIGYDTPFDVVERLLVEAGLDTPRVLTTPKPYVLEPELHDYYVIYELCAYTTRATELHLIESELRRRIQLHLNAAGIEIRSPALVAVRDGSPHAPEGGPSPVGSVVGAAAGAVALAKREQEP